MGPLKGHGTLKQIHFNFTFVTLPPVSNQETQMSNQGFDKVQWVRPEWGCFGNHCTTVTCNDILQMSSGNVPVLIYDLTATNCPLNELEVLGKLLQGNGDKKRFSCNVNCHQLFCIIPVTLAVLNSNDVNILGCDMMNVLDNLDLHDAGIRYVRVCDQNFRS